MSLGTTVRSLMRAATNRFPGASQGDIQKFVLLQLDTAVRNGSQRGVKDSELLDLADKAFDEAVAAGEEWAVSLANAFRDNTIKPIVDKARRKGVDPVPAVVTQTDLTEDQARAMVESLDAEAPNEGEHTPWDKAEERAEVAALS